MLCTECGFREQFDGDLCIECMNDRLNAQKYKISRTILNKETNWEDKKIKQAWRKSSEESMQQLLAKCSGTNYHNGQK